MDLWIALSETVRDLGLAVAAGVGAFLAWRELGPRTCEAGTAMAQAELSRRAHVTELFNRAAGQLADEKLEVRLAAIYVPREVGRDVPDLANPVFELLEIHLAGRQAEYGQNEPPVDVKAIIATVNSRRQA